MSAKSNKLPTLDLSCAGPLVQALGVAGFDDVQRCVDEDLDESEAGLFVQLASDGTVGTVWRNERGQGNAARVCEKF